MQRYTVDRLEDQDWAVLEDEHSRTLTIPIAWLPAGVREGDVIAVTDDGGGPGARILRFELDPAGKDERLEQARALRNALGRGPEGDVAL